MLASEISAASDCETASDGVMLQTRGDSYMKRSSRRLGEQIKDTGLTLGVDDEPSLLLAVNVSSYVHSKEMVIKNALI